MKALSKGFAVALGGLGLVALIAFVSAAEPPNAPTVGPAARPAAAAPATPRGGSGNLRTDAVNAGVDFSPQPPVQTLSPAEQLKLFVLQPGYRLEPVLADPFIQEPTAIAFDGNGRMFVLEQRGFQKRAGSNDRDPLGLISRHVDEDGDGVYEKHTAFVDGLVFPRFVTPFGRDAILTMETDGDDVWKYTDTDHDGVADRKELFATSFGRASPIENQQAFLISGLDNWMYSTVNAFRIRWTPDGVVREPTGANGAQWGAVQDDDGKVWFQGGSGGLPTYFQFPIVYGTIPVPDQFETGFATLWGPRLLAADVQSGMGGIRESDGALNVGTAAAGNDIVRGHRMPADLQGDYLYGETAGRLVRRVHPVVSEGITQLRNANPRDEFIKSTDPLFRPVDLATAPDGTVYLVDMYHGRIADSTTGGPQTYIRARLDQFQLEQAQDRGRVWRLSHESMARDPNQPRMLDENVLQLVAHLEHPNGWWRDTAQQLLVLAQDKSVVPALQRMARNSSLLTARSHALWTLEGLGALNAAFARELLADREPRMRIQAIRASETLYKAGDRTFANDYAAASRDPETNVAIQALLTLNTLKVASAADLARAARTNNPARGVQIVTGELIKPSAPTGRAGPVTRGGIVVAPNPLGAGIYADTCAVCHGVDGLGTSRPGGPPGTTMAPPLAGSARVNGHRDYLINVLLHGLIGPVGGVSYQDQMPPLRANTDEWIAAIASHVRSNFGNAAGPVTGADVARVRAAAATREPWTVDGLTGSLPVVLPSRPTWKLTAGQNAETAGQALSLRGWTSGVAAPDGMWLQLELPEAASLTEVQFSENQATGGRGILAVATNRNYDLDVSLEGRNWTRVMQVAGTGGMNAWVFAPVRARFVRIVAVPGPTANRAMQINSLKLLQPGAAARVD